MVFGVTQELSRRECRALDKRNMGNTMEGEVIHTELVSPQAVISRAVSLQVLCGYQLFRSFFENVAGESLQDRVLLPQEQQRGSHYKTRPQKP